MPRTARRRTDPFGYCPIPVADPAKTATLRAHYAGQRATKRTKAGTKDRRYGPRVLPDYAAATPLSIADYAIGQQHAADLEDAGLAVTLEACGQGDAETWRIADSEDAVSHFVWRRNNRFGVRVRHGIGSDAGGFNAVRMFSNLDAAFNHVRLHLRMDDGHHAAEASVAAAALVSLPAWLVGAA